MTDCKINEQIIQGQKKLLIVPVSKDGLDTEPSTATNIQAVFDKEAANEFLIKKLNRVAVAEISTIKCVSDVGGNLASKFFFYNTIEKEFVFYAKVNGVGSAPGLVGKTEIAFNVPNDDDDQDAVALALQTAMNAQVEISASVLNDIVTATNATAGGVDDLSEGGQPTGFTFAVTTKGLNEITGEIEVNNNPKVEITLSKEDTALLKSGTAQNFYLVIDFPSPTGRQIVSVGDFDVSKTTFLDELE